MTTDYSAARERNFQHAIKQLRERAEKRREQFGQLNVGDTPPMTQRLIQELQVHQIELEMQYEELLVTQAETERLRARYTDLFDFAPIGYVAVDVLGMVQELNLAGAKLLGTTRHRLTNRRFLQFVALPSRDAFLQFVIDVLATEDSLSIEVDLLRDDETPLRVRIDGISMPDPQGTRLCRLALIDLTAQHHATHERERGEARFQTYLDNSPDGVLLLRNDFIIFGNPVVVRQLGVADDDALVGRHLADFAPSTQPDGRDSRTVADLHLARAQRAGHARFEWVSRRADTGEDAWQEVTLTAFTTENGSLVLAAWRDLTDRKQAEARLTQAQRTTDDLLNLSLQAAERGLWTWDPTTDQLTLDERAQETIFGPKVKLAEAATLATLLQALHPDDRPRAQRDITGALDAPEPVQMNWRAVWPDGSEHYVATLGHAVCEGHGGQPLCFNGLVREEPAGSAK